ncbi:hypothetical protein EJV46_04340 [Roseococcus sp. SYP-B2431]|uniref:DUF7002 family protein n=1 Tax=Roseococcus sp. SYP-B2431 TaxID=2496640 RepID=UPI00103B2B32|nr:hypothetical protein [Roseococcus sp. SYP-B2431]TCH99900.1 hypothetical protein EJV46_04340 [Roseococcus sp. SYP-B2431]
MNGFAARVPLLYHATPVAAVKPILDEGLLPAAALAERHGQAITDNRDRWLCVPGGEMLRRQGMPDKSLASRLGPGLSPEDWRVFINGHVFLFPDRTAAAGLAASKRDADVPQAVLEFETAALLAAGLRLVFCRFNNGFLDRSPPDKRRLRGFQDYRPIEEWRSGAGLKEIAILGGVPAGIGDPRLASG